MKMEQLRERTGELSPDELRLVVAELYRMLPKKVAEAKAADQLIQNPKQFVTAGRPKRIAPIPDLDTVLFDTEQFLEDARQQKYFAPNRDIPKSERAKWRFIVKRLHREWILLAEQPANLPAAIKALEDLFEILRRASQVYLFPTTEPFRAIGVPEHEFHQQLCSLKSRTLPPREWLSQALARLRKRDWHESTSAEMHAAFLTTLKTTELKEEALDLIANEFRSGSPSAPKARGSDAWNSALRQQDMVRLGFRILWALGEFDRAQDWVKAHAQSPLEGDHLLMELLLATEDAACWVRAYEALLRQAPDAAQPWAKTMEHVREHGTLQTYQMR